MTNVWAEMSDIGYLLSLIAVAPFILGMGFLMLKAGLFGSDPAMLQ